MPGDFDVFGLEGPVLQGLVETERVELGVRCLVIVSEGDVVRGNRNNVLIYHL